MKKLFGELRDIKHAIRHEMRRIRREKRISQSELSLILGCSHALVSRMELGQRSVKEKWIKKIIVAQEKGQL